MCFSKHTDDHCCKKMAAESEILHQERKDTKTTQNTKAKTLQILMQLYVGGQTYIASPVKQQTHG